MGLGKGVGRALRCLLELGTVRAILVTEREKRTVQGKPQPSYGQDTSATMSDVGMWTVRPL